MYTLLDCDDFGRLQQILLFFVHACAKKVTLTADLKEPPVKIL
jgi:hypothetical protein